MRRLICTLAMMACAFLPATAGATTRYITTSGSDSAACTQAAPCKTFSGVYAKSTSGDVVEVAAGTYPAQGTINAPMADGGTKTITFHGATGAKVRQLISGASNITFDGLDLDAGGVKTAGAVFETNGAHDVTFKNGRIGNVVDEKGALLGGQVSAASLNVVIDNVEFHDVSIVDQTVHSECIYSQAPGLTVKNSRFGGVCGSTGAIFLTRGDWWGQQPYGGWTFTNNTFARQLYDHGSIIFAGACGSTCDGATFRGNTFDPASMPNDAIGNRTFTNSVESCNTPRVDFPGIVHETCGTPDTTPPQTTITQQPVDSQSTDATLAFTADEPSTFECSLDSAPYSACTSPKSYSGLMVGGHVFLVRAKDTAGNVDATPASASWTVTASQTCDQACEDAYQAQIDAWKARAEKAEATLAQIHDLSAP
jgi:hypothetical protein